MYPYKLIKHYDDKNQKRYQKRPRIAKLSIETETSAEFSRVKVSLDKLNREIK